MRCTALLLSCLVGIGCARAYYSTEGDRIKVTWSDHGFFATDHTLVMPARSGRIDAGDVAYTQRALLSRLRPRSSDGYVELDLVHRTMELNLSFPMDKEQGWTGHFMEMELLKRLQSVGPLVPFYRNGRYGLVRKRE